MQLRNDAIRLHHIFHSARKAVSFTYGRSPSDMNKDYEVLALALVRLLEIIGEASTGITGELKAKYPEIPWSQMSSTNNRLIHGYFDINYELVWKTATEELPLLIAQMQKLLAEEDL